MPAIWIPKRLVDLNLINTAGLSKQSFIRHCEFEYESRVYAAAKEIIEENRHIIMLTGPSASGKTTTAHKLKDKLINMGKKEIAMLRDGWGIVTKDGQPSAHYENTVLITNEGVEILTL